MRTDTSTPSLSTADIASRLKVKPQTIRKRAKRRKMKAMQIVPGRSLWSLDQMAVLAVPLRRHPCGTYGKSANRR